MDNLKPIRRCSYRNCIRIVEGRSDKKYCSSSCRSQEGVYMMRERKHSIKEKNNIKSILSSYKEGFSEDVMNLYKKIFLN